MANRIPSQYITIVQKSLVAAAGVAPLGIFGALDTVGVGATWAAMFLQFGIKLVPHWVQTLSVFVWELHLA